ncbi:MAG: sigma-70 family RNA polymerase sigma factor, partial [Tunicatimonas sp.]|uniref:sigma-70 family RNA polymerase sigma factor n=1 Tax=Tunicatimonas sp. TaxID=1940096 RepID=UPI003C73961F
MQSEDGHYTLVKALKRGSTAAFKQVYERYKRPLYATALRYLKDNQLAEDVLQDVFVKLWQNREALDEQQSLKNFLFVCLKNQVLNFIRSEQVRIKAALLANQNQDRVS